MRPEQKQEQEKPQDLELEIFDYKLRVITLSTEELEKLEQEGKAQDTREWL